VLPLWKTLCPPDTCAIISRLSKRAGGLVAVLFTASMASFYLRRKCNGIANDVPLLILKRASFMPGRGFLPEGVFAPEGSAFILGNVQIANTPKSNPMNPEPNNPIR